MKRNTIWYVFLAALLIVCNAIALALCKQKTPTFFVGLLFMNYAIVIFFIFSTIAGKDKLRLLFHYPLVSITALYSSLCIICSIICFIYPTILIEPILIALLVLTFIWVVIVIALTRHNQRAIIESDTTEHATELINNWQRILTQAALRFHDQTLQSKIYLVVKSCQYLVASSAPKYAIYNRRITALCNKLLSSAEANSDDIISTIEEINTTIKLRKNV